MGNVFGNFIGGVLWGVGASLAGRVVGGAGTEETTFRDVTKGAVKGYLAVADRVQGLIEDTQRGFADVVAEAEQEYRASTSSGTAAR
jgi:hypothetical protein